jgi:ribosomal-protein-alanine N-acetyltransferase
MPNAKIFIETERLLMRELMPEDEQIMFELESDLDVQRFVHKNPLKTMQECRKVISMLRAQYSTSGTARLAVIEKESGMFIGLCGLKLERDTINGHMGFYDLGYRFLKDYWGKGYATEAAKATVAYGFGTMGFKCINGMAYIGNTASHIVLQKAGLSYVETFEYEGEPTKWYEAINPKTH